MNGRRHGSLGVVFLPRAVRIARSLSPRFCQQCLIRVAYRSQVNLGTRCSGFVGRCFAMKNVSWNRLTHRVLLSFLEMLLVCVFNMPMSAQFTTARLSGTVLDPSGGRRQSDGERGADGLYSRYHDETAQASIYFPVCPWAPTRLPSQ